MYIIYTHIYAHRLCVNVFTVVMNVHLLGVWMCFCSLFWWVERYSSCVSVLGIQGLFFSLLVYVLMHFPSPLSSLSLSLLDLEIQYKWWQPVDVFKSSKVLNEQSCVWMMQLISSPSLSPLSPPPPRSVALHAGVCMQGLVRDGYMVSLESIKWDFYFKFISLLPLSFFRLPHQMRQPNKLLMWYVKY